MKEQLYNIILSIKSFFRQTFSNAEGKGPSIKNYEIVLDEKFKSLRNWQIGLQWISTLIKGNNQFYSKSATVCLDGYLNLKQIDTNYVKINDQILSRNAIGAITSNSSYKYGIFEITACLPIGENLSPSISLISNENVQNKITIINAKSNEDILYSKGWRTMSNLASIFEYTYNNDGNTKNMSLKPMYHSLRYSKLGNFIKFTCVWENDKIEIWYNGYLVRKITNKKVLNSLNDNMYILINHSIILNAMEWSRESDFKIKTVKIYQKIN